MPRLRPADVYLGGAARRAKVRRQRSGFLQGDLTRFLEALGVTNHDVRASPLGVQPKIIRPRQLVSYTLVGVGVTAD